MNTHIRTHASPPTRAPRTAFFLDGFHAATRARAVRSSHFAATRAAALLEWRTSHTHLGYAEQTRGLDEVRRGWDTAVALRAEVSLAA
ncbi:hypothetical protein D9V32_01345 [Mycetocola tolaasinivorans]|uniref:Uncharacterized protein n=1 Tax=Mycetocola tolaasinivorans TaxID=76635 RepID=A0A3L7ADB3_9MICO|nr:hypothetical protein [Mycetocola tolaasinivorans]RLP78005.1 hypothetical protein D9V32_01345 [Mycetocola tolaasinivorans]